jgi:lipopolysaccharide/colanic/teichoic acid biosynthesis glycosyltransferase
MPNIVGRSIAATALIILGPALLLIALAVRVTSPGPVLHRATRVRPGGTFTLLKFRSMGVGSESAGTAVTAAGDPRVTHIGRTLRRTKLDELPQLINVVRGDMDLVGPRPEDPKFVDVSDPLHQLVFSARPGITGPTAIAFRDEEETLASEALAFAHEAGRQAPTSHDIERAYRERLLPRKLAMDADYLRTRSTRRDLALITATVTSMFARDAGR